MRLEYTFQLDNVAIPRFAVEAVEGIGKLFTLATLVLNVLALKDRVEIVFHGLNPDDPGRKIDAFLEIVGTSDVSELTFTRGRGGIAREGPTPDGGGQRVGQRRVQLGERAHTARVGEPAREAHAFEVHELRDHAIALSREEDCLLYTSDAADEL